MVQPVSETIDFPKEEEKIISLWNQLDVFKTCLKQSKGKPRYSFYDGPPFATGLPHYGHILAGTIKDIVTRYAHQRGYHVERRFGWDCHGLPVEFEIDKTLGIKGPEDVAKMGIDKYNNECRKIVMRYASEWERIVGRLGRWIDFQNDYKTLYPWFMESIWWVFKELFVKGLVYRGVKVMPYSTACNTPLSNFESGQNYKEVVDPAVIVSFPLVDEPDVVLLAWTTTPWTLPSNLSLCVNPDLNYVKVKDVTSGNVYVLMEARLEILYKKDDQYIVMEIFKGEKLKGKRYKPLFPYFSNMSERGAFQVLNDGYVTEESGTGIVHQAPYFGEDDYRVCLVAGIITRDQDIICPVDASGRFTQPVTHFLGQHVKDADKNIIKWLKEAGRLVNSSTMKHSYPFCWRSETPLIYKAVPSWFVRVEQMSKDLLQSSQSTYWVPDFVKEKRFGNWLRDARDWAISRNRYWGTPIPLWISFDGEEIVCVGSTAELEELTGTKVRDLHRENIDHLTIPSRRPGQPPLKRVPEVFDCWFESGSMPYAQMHYPFERTKEFEDCFPADFIAEGIDQTRGWFYTLLVISTALFNKPPFKNLIANGLVLAADGQKMSKRKKNYPDPMEVVNKFGADALRLYLINSPVVRAENLRFKEEGVRDVLKDVFLPWYNAYRFLMQNIDRLAREDRKKLVFVENAHPEKLSQNLMDRWILSFTQSLLQFVKREMAAYRLYTVIPRLMKFIDNLTNWYVRMNRKRLKGEGGVADCHNALHTLYHVLYSMIRIMAPFTPFLTEIMYQNLRHFLNAESVMDSVHYIMLPEPTSALINEDIEKAVALMQMVIDLGRVIRDRKTIPVKYPLPEVVVIHHNEQSLQHIVSLEHYILEELNVRKVTVTTDKKTYGVTFRAEPDHKTLGARLKGAFKPVMQAIKDLTDEEIHKFLLSRKMELLGHTIEQSDIRIMFSFSTDSGEYEAHAENDLIVLLNTVADEAMQDEGIAREVINRVQKLRKKAHLVPSDPVTVYYSIDPEDSPLQRITTSHSDFIENTLKVPLIPLKKMPPDAQSQLVIEETQQLKGSLLNLVVVRVKQTEGEPFCRYVNVELCGLKPRYGAKKINGMILLENPVQENGISIDQLKREIEILFGIYGIDFEVCFADNGKVLTSVQDLGNLHKKLLYVCRKGYKKKLAGSSHGPLCRFVNVDHNGRKATVLLDNESGDDDVKKLVACVFGVEAEKLHLTLHSGHMAVTLMCVRVLFEIGHEASIRSKRTPEGFTHDWELFVRGADNTEINHFVEKVIFYLHDTFPKPVRVVKEPPYSVKESGYAGFNLQIDIYFRTEEEPKKVRFNYDLNLQPSGPSITKVQREKYVFRNPDEDLRRRLIRGGGVGVGSDASSHSSSSSSGDKPSSVSTISSTTDDTSLKSSSSQLVSKPKLGGDTAKKHKTKEHRAAEEPRVSSNSFEDFFGVIKKPSPSTKVSPLPKPGKPPEKANNDKSTSITKPAKPKDASGGKSSSGGSSSGGLKEEKKDKNKERDKSKEKEKSKHVSTPPKLPQTTKPSKEEPKKSHSDEHKAKSDTKSTGESSKIEKKKKEKRSKDEKNKKDRHKEHDSKSSEKSIKDKESSRKPEKESDKPKEKEKPTGDGEKEHYRHKHKKKEREKRDDSAKEKDRDRDKKVKKSSSDSKKTNDTKDKDKNGVSTESSKKRLQSPSHNSPRATSSPKPLPVPEKLPPPPLPPPPPPPPPINKDKSSKKSHSQRFEEIDPNSSPVSVDEDSVETDVPPPVENKAEPAVKADVQNENQVSSSNNKLSKSEENYKVNSNTNSTKQKEKNSCRKSKEKKESVSSSVKDESGSSKKRKRKSSVKAKEEEASTDDTPAPKLPKLDLEVGKSSDDVVNETSSQMEVSAKVPQEVMKEVETSPPAPQFSPDYVLQLKELQRKIMTLEDNAELQRVVQVIAETGQYEITKKTFDFDLCALDRSTVKRLQDFFTTS